MEDLPLGRIAALVPEFAVKDKNVVNRMRAFLVANVAKLRKRIHIWS